MRVSVRKTNTADPVLNRIQDAVSEAVDDLDLYKSDALQFRYDREPIVQVGLSEAVVLMSTESTVRANLPAPAPANANRRCALARRDFGRTIVVTASGGNVQATDSDTLPSAAGLYIYYSTGSEWFRC